MSCLRTIVSGVLCEGRLSPVDLLEEQAGRVNDWRALTDAVQARSEAYAFLDVLWTMKAKAHRA